MTGKVGAQGAIEELHGISLRLAEDEVYLEPGETKAVNVMATTSSLLGRQLWAKQVAKGPKVIEGPVCRTKGRAGGLVSIMVGSTMGEASHLTRGEIVAMAVRADKRKSQIRRRL
jgi:hypothetical protein